MFRPFPLLPGAVVASLLAASFMGGCAHHRPIETPEQAMRPADAPTLQDDLPLDSLIEAVAVDIEALEKMPPSGLLRFGPKTVSVAAYSAALRRFHELAKSTLAHQIPQDEFFRAVRRDFDFYEVYGREEWGDVFLTSYYEAWVPGSLKETSRFSQPLYATPDDLVSLNLTAFDAKYSDDRKLRGRLDGRKLVPYYSREEIDTRKALKGRGLEICWLDPIDAFFLQIQGSGVVDLGNGKRLRINYAEKNGHRYASIGNFLKDRIPIDQLNLASIESVLRGLSPEERQALFNRNPSYVFFRASDESAVTALGVPATDGRTIATDPKFFPKGALAFLVTTKPRFADASATQPSGFDPMARFVLDQDMGGAIQGPGRLDLFWGRGSDAKRSAGFMKQHGTLFYLVPKNSTP